MQDLLPGDGHQRIGSKDKNTLQISYLQAFTVIFGVFFVSYSTVNREILLSGNL